MDRLVSVRDRGGSRGTGSIPTARQTFAWSGNGRSGPRCRAISFWYLGHKMYIPVGGGRGPHGGDEQRHVGRVRREPRQRAQRAVQVLLVRRQRQQLQRRHAQLHAHLVEHLQPPDSHRNASTYLILSELPLQKLLWGYLVRSIPTPLHGVERVMSEISSDQRSTTGKREASSKSISPTSPTTS